jgi:hypothetical protein
MPAKLTAHELKPDSARSSHSTQHFSVKGTDATFHDWHVFIPCTMTSEELRDWLTQLLHWCHCLRDRVHAMFEAGYMFHM